ncbi:polysaccharide biosynthesis protein [Variibacter gotjawalensis]|uniref:Polysaccharide biosynthesis protein n=1 Tax=Variibacter gotjawalensis TaxID=1333996 RepID=A0A0S3PZY7_9BRAD|nr:lipopolysaccharide biosynthesis protein [Variibacter gotjawalensis]NIK47327.1 O-antigen/teichoic acid export membrane protein [Variibacter gotjawalensis]RZS49225.1 O-antigen/teichoic acid export membrane protein [Variibacter gotjawalensis]BAT61487.1 polysaccharide biosynthesis protein [Variibacter gotjawalensis]
MLARFLKGSVFGALAGAAIALGSFASGVVIARLLGVTQTGHVAYVVWLALLVAPIIDLGFAATVGRYIPALRGADDGEQVHAITGYLARRLVAACCLFVAAAIILLLILADINRLSVAAPLAIAGGAVVVAQTLGAFAYAYFRGIVFTERAAQFAIASFALQFLAVAGGSYAFGAVGAVGSYAVAMVLPAIFALFLTAKWGTVPPDMRKRMRRYALFAWGSNIAGALVWSRVEVFFLERYWGLDSVGLFAIALALSALAAQGPTLMANGVLAFMAEKHGRKDQAGVGAAYSAGTRAIALIAFPLCLSMVAAIPILLPAIYGKAFTGAVPAAMIIVAAAAITVPSIIATNLVQAAERNDFIFGSSLVGAAVSMLCGILLIPRYGLVGAALSRAAVQLALVAIGAVFIHRALGFAFPILALVRTFVAALLSSLVIAGCLLATGTILVLVAAIPLAIASYPLTLRLLGVVSSSDAALMANGIALLPSQLRPLCHRVVQFVVSSSNDDGSDFHGKASPPSPA